MSSFSMFDFIKDYHTLSEQLRREKANEFYKCMVEIYYERMTIVTNTQSLDIQQQNNLLLLAHQMISQFYMEQKDHLIAAVGLLALYFETFTGKSIDIIYHLGQEFWTLVFDKFSDDEFKKIFPSGNRGLLWFHVALRYENADLFSRWLSLGGDFCSLSEQDQRKAWSFAYQKQHSDLITQLRNLIYPEIVTFSRVRADFSQHPVANLMGYTMSPVKTFLYVAHLYDVSVTESGTYARSGKYPLASSFKRQVRQYPLLNGANRAHVGDYTNPMQSLGDTFQSSRLLIRRDILMGDAFFYDRILKYQWTMSQHVINKMQPTQFIHVGIYNQLPCVMVFINDHTMPTKPTDATKEAWVELVISFFNGIINYLAFLNSIPIELARRASFGFITPTIAPTGQSFRINIGIVPAIYVDLLVQALQFLDQLLGHFIRNQESYKIPEGTFNQTAEYKNYLETKAIGRKYLDEILKCSNVLQLLWAQADIGGRTTVYNLMRTSYAQQKITMKVFDGLRNLQSNEDAIPVFVNTLQWAVKQLAIESQTLHFRVDKNTISYPISFECLEAKSIEDQNFWNLQQQIVQRIATLPNQLPLFQNTLKKLQECCKNQKLVVPYYFYLEIIQRCFLVHAIQTSHMPISHDGYGSDSDEEDNVENKRVYAKKVITHNGMRAIWGAVLGIRAVCLMRNPQYTSKVYINSVYYEVPDGLTVLNHHHGATGNIGKEKNIAYANICIFDLNHCVTNGEPVAAVIEQLKQVKARVLVLDSTSATTDQCREYLHWIVKNMQQFEAVFFVASGLKFQQFGSDTNHYGTIRIFAHDRKILNEYYDAIKKEELPLLSSVSHTHRRMMKDLGFVPRNSLFFRFREQKESHGVDDNTPQPGVLPLPG